MLTKLAFKNVGKSVRDYAIYFLTLVLAVSIFYMFNSIYEQQDIMIVTKAVSESMVVLKEMLSIISIFVAVVLGFLIIYANNFFIKRRKKELGVYMILGMGKGKISFILVLETLVMGIIALLVGLVLGVFASQFMSIFTAEIFEADMSAYRFMFSPDAAVKSVFYFTIIFLTVILFNAIGISKCKLIDLLYGGRRNEALKVRHKGISIVLFLLSVVCLAIAYKFILKNGMFKMDIFFISSIILGTIGTLLFFFSLSGILTALVQSDKRIYYKDLNIFVTRQLTSKINTNFISISVICIILLLVIGIFSSGNSIQSILSKDLKEKAVYDFSFYGDEEDRSLYERLPSFVKEADMTYHEYNIYQREMPLFYKDFPVDYSSLPFAFGGDVPSFLLLSDYNKILEMQGKEEVTLLDEEYLIVSSKKAYHKIVQQFVDKQVAISLKESVLLPKEEQNISLSNNDFYSIIFVVENSFLDSFGRAKDVVVNMAAKDREEGKALQEKITEFKDSPEYSKKEYWYMESREEIYIASVTSRAILAFLAMYLGIVFMIACTAILAIQQLAQAADNKERYTLLRKLGAEKTMLNRALFLQILCYFLLPLVLAIVHSVVGLTAANKTIKALGDINVTHSIFATALFIVIVYGIYFGLTYMASKNIIKKDE